MFVAAIHKYHTRRIPAEEEEEGGQPSWNIGGFQNLFGYNIPFPRVVSMLHCFNMSHLLA